jgi:hypothetical protein
MITWLKMYKDKQNYFLHDCNCFDIVNSSEVRSLCFVAKAGDLEKCNVIKSRGIARLSGRASVAYTHHSTINQRKSLYIL